MLSRLCIPIQEDLVESFIAMVPGEGEVADKGSECVQGLQSLNRASGGLLMSFCGSQGS